MAAYGAETCSSPVRRCADQLKRSAGICGWIICARCGHLTTMDPKYLDCAFVRLGMVLLSAYWVVSRVVALVLGELARSLCSEEIAYAE